MFYRLTPANPAMLPITYLSARLDAEPLADLAVLLAQGERAKVERIGEMHDVLAVFELSGPIQAFDVAAHAPDISLRADR